MEATYHWRVIRAAYLRVYVPASTIVDLPPHRPAPSDLKSDGNFLWSEATSEDAIYTLWEGTQFVCPRNVRLRMVESVLAFTKLHPEMRLVTDTERLEYVAELSTLRKASNHARGHILASAWHVPLRWFSAFSPSEREVYEFDGITSIRYRTTLGEAIDRVRWSVGVLDSAGFSDQVISRVEDLEQWLTAFGADAMVELDYGTVAGVFPDAELAFDESAADVRESLLALERGDFPDSRDAYERVARRWADPQAYTLSN